MNVIPRGIPVFPRLFPGNNGDSKGEKRGFPGMWYFHVVQITIPISVRIQQQVRVSAGIGYPPVSAGTISGYPDTGIPSNPRDRDRAASGAQNFDRFFRFFGLFS